MSHQDNQSSKPDRPARQETSIHQLVAEVADLEAHLAALRAQLPAHSVPPAMIMALDDAEEQLAEARARLASAGNLAP